MSVSLDQRDIGNWSSLLARGVAGGIVVGALFLAANMWFATSMGDPAKGPLLMMSTIVKGDEAMMAGTASVGVGLAVHLALSALFGVVFAVLASFLKSAGALALAGVAFGAGLYLLNFKVFAPTLFTTFEMANQPFELVAHVAFGVLLAVAFLVPLSSPATTDVEPAARRHGAAARA